MLKARFTKCRPFYPSDDEGTIFFFVENLSSVKIFADVKEFFEFTFLWSKKANACDKRRGSDSCKLQMRSKIVQLENGAIKGNQMIINFVKEWLEIGFRCTIDKSYGGKQIFLSFMNSVFSYLYLFVLFLPIFWIFFSTCFLSVKVN